MLFEEEDTCYACVSGPLGVSYEEEDTCYARRRIHVMRAFQGLLACHMRRRIHVMRAFEGLWLSSGTFVLPSIRAPGSTIQRYLSVLPAAQSSSKCAPGSANTAGLSCREHKYC